MSQRVDGPIVVGIDGSHDALRALRLAGEIARAARTKLVVLHAVGLTELIDGERVVTEGHQAEIAEQFARWCRTIDDLDIDDCDPQLRHGAPVDTLLRVADEVGASLVVIGRQGAGKRPELLLGSTAHQVAEHCRCPVLIVPPAGRSHRS